MARTYSDTPEPRFVERAKNADSATNATNASFANSAETARKAGNATSAESSSYSSYAESSNSLQFASVNFPLSFVPDVGLTFWAGTAVASIYDFILGFKPLYLTHVPLDGDSVTYCLVPTKIYSEGSYTQNYVVLSCPYCTMTIRATETYVTFEEGAITIEEPSEENNEPTNEDNEPVEGSERE